MTTSKRQRRSAIIAGAALCLTALTTPAAIATPNPGSLPAATFASRVETTSETDAQLRTFFNQYGVAVSTQDALLAKLDQGEMWLSLTPGAQPVREEQSQDAGMNVTVRTYADGSIAVSSASIPEGQPGYPGGNGEVTTRSVYGCSASGSTGYAWYWTNCVADNNWGVVRMYFNFNYEFVKGTTAKITKYWNPRYLIVLGAFSNHRFVEMSASDVRYMADYSAIVEGSPVGWSMGLGLFVSGSTASTYLV